MVVDVRSVEGGELFDRVIDVNQFEESVAKLLFYQMAMAVKVQDFVWGT